MISRSDWSRLHNADPVRKGALQGGKKPNDVRNLPWLKPIQTQIDWFMRVRAKRERKLRQLVAMKRISEAAALEEVRIMASLHYSLLCALHGLLPANTPRARMQMPAIELLPVFHAIASQRGDPHAQRHHRTEAVEPEDPEPGPDALGEDE